MPVSYSRWDRRDAADRNAMGAAALDLCRAMRAMDGVDDARFYWSGTDSLVLLTHGGAGTLSGPPSPQAAAANFALADLAHQTAAETWFDPSQGMEMYNRATG
jgi:hypothetical protein